jgi:hypothetical protein
VPSARALTLILFACVPIALVFSFTIIGMLAEAIAVLALIGLIAVRVEEWTRGLRNSKPSG